MPDNRYFLDAPLSSHALVSLEGDEWHHLTHVMRAKPGKCIELVNGRGQIARATLTALHKKSATAHVEEIEELPFPQYSLVLAQALPLPSILPWIIEKGTELGATAFWLFPGEKSKSIYLSDNQRRRLYQTTISSMKQCGRLYLPSIVEKPRLIDWQEPLQGSLFFGDPTSSIAISLPPPGDIVLFIGPESGLSINEVEFLQKSLNVKGIRLHPNTLRTETAAICALSIFSQILTTCLN